MAVYRLKRKTFGFIGDTAKQVAGGVMEGTGKALDSSVGGLAGRVGGAMAGGAIAGPVGFIAGALLGHKVSRGLGKGLKNAGQDMQM